MEEPSHLTDFEAFRESSLNGLVDLQRFLAEELEDFEKQAGSLRRAFRPLSDGLGLEPPKRRDEAPLAPPAGKGPSLVDLAAPFVKPAAPSSYQEWFQPEDEAGEEVAPPSVEVTAPGTADVVETPALAPAPTPAGSPVTSPVVETPTLSAVGPEPPPMPQPSWWRRIQAALIDDVFVLTLWVGALVITANLLSGFSTGFSLGVLKLFAKPVFLRFAALEFATLWLGYFALGIGLLDMTFGMWVWGIRVAYGEAEEARFARKVSRILLSFFFFAPVFPSVLLAVRMRGRNLLDSLSGTTLYRTGA